MIAVTSRSKHRPHRMNPMRSRPCHRHTGHRSRRHSRVRGKRNFRICSWCNSHKVKQTSDWLLARASQQSGPRMIRTGIVRKLVCNGLPSRDCQQIRSQGQSQIEMLDILLVICLTSVNCVEGIQELEESCADFSERQGVSRPCRVLRVPTEGRRLVARFCLFTEILPTFCGIPPQ